MWPLGVDMSVNQESLEGGKVSMILVDGGVVGVDHPDLISGLQRHHPGTHPGLEGRPLPRSVSRARGGPFHHPVIII